MVLLNHILEVNDYDVWGEDLLDELTHDQLFHKVKVLIKKKIRHYTEQYAKNNIEFYEAMLSK